MSHSLLSVQEISPVFPDSGGIAFLIKGSKESNFVPKQQGRIYVESEEFWKAMKFVFGSAMISTLKMTMHPFFLSKDILDLSSFKEGFTSFSSCLNIGTSNGTVGMFKRSTVIKKLNKMILQGDPQFCISIRIGDKKKEEVLFDINTSCSQILREEARGGNILNPMEETYEIDLSEDHDEEGSRSTTEPDALRGDEEGRINGNVEELDTNNKKKKTKVQKIKSALKKNKKGKKGKKERKIKEKKQRANGKESLLSNDQSSYSSASSETTSIGTSTNNSIISSERESEIMDKPVRILIPIVQTDESNPRVPLVHSKKKRKSCFLCCCCGS